MEIMSLLMNLKNNTFKVDTVWQNESQCQLSVSRILFPNCKINGCYLKPGKYADEHDVQTANSHESY